MTEHDPLYNVSEMNTVCKINCLCLGKCMTMTNINYFQDLKSDKQRARMSVARSILEKSTMMLLTASKVNGSIAKTMCMKYVPLMMINV